MPEQAGARFFQGIHGVAFPRHPQVESEERVVRLVKQFLGPIEAEGPGLAQTDLLQGFAIVNAMRLSVAEPRQEPGTEPAIELIDVATEALTRARLEPESSSTPRVQ